MSSTPSLRVLIIEQSQDLQELIKLGIDLTVDATVTLVHSIVEAIEYLQQSLADIIFLGFEHHGIDALIELKSQPQVQPIPVIVMMNRTRLSDHQKITYHGASAALSYTFEPKQLSRLLQEVLREFNANEG